MKKIVIALLLFYIAGARARAQDAPAFWKDIVTFKSRDTAHPQLQHAILFVGSSSFTKWTDVQSYFPAYPIINRGFGGSTLLDVIRYAYDIIIPYHPKQVLVYCGENDLAASDTVTADEVVTRFKTLYGMIRQNLPETEIDFVAIKLSPSRQNIFPRVLEANKKIADFLKKEKKGAFIDVSTPMLGANGQPREEIFLDDRLHMKAEGYRIWQKAILPYLKK